MRRLLACTAVASALLLTACGGAAKDTVNSAIDQAQSAASSAAAAASSAAAEVSSAAASAEGDPGTSSDPGSGSGECGGLTQEDVGKFIVYTQVLAQATDLDAVKGLKESKVADYTPDAMKQVLDKMESLRGKPGPGQPDPGGALDYFQKANDLLGAVFASEADPTQAQVDELKAAIVDVPTALKNQLAINLSLAANCGQLG